MLLVTFFSGCAFEFARGGGDRGGYGMCGLRGSSEGGGGVNYEQSAAIRLTDVLVCLADIQLLNQQVSIFQHKMAPSTSWVRC